MKFETIEILITVTFVLIQLLIFIRTLKKIRIYKNLIPDTSSLKVSKAYCSAERIKNKLPSEIYEKIQGGEYENDPASCEDAVEIIFIEKSDTNDLSQYKIIDLINNNLIAQSKHDPDINQINELVERNTEAAEDDINLTISTPIYIGLMATIFGIIIGLTFISREKFIVGQGINTILDSGLSMLIGGVKIAMIASFTGLLLTTLNSGIYFKNAKRKVEFNKNSFFAFLKANIYTLINNDENSLQNNLNNFNRTFSENINKFSHIFDNVSQILQNQQSIIKSLNTVEFLDVQKNSIAVLEQVNASAESFKGFNEYLSKLNTFIENSEKIVERTNNIVHIADTIKTNLDTSRELMEFLTSHLKQLEKHGDMAEAAINQNKQEIDKKLVDLQNRFVDVFRELENYIKNKNQAIQDFAVQEEQKLREALSSSHTYLGNLTFLPELKEGVENFKKDLLEKTNGQSIEINNNLQKLNVNLANILLQMQKNGTGNELSFPFNILKKIRKNRIKDKN
ncbi:MAG TPA: hypothetical protein PKW80_00655 [Bacteroidales bacterium]|nr:hypothetical protein [Bacteroidales bacterium]